MSFKSNCGFGKRKRQNNEFRPHGNVPCDSFDDAILITEQKKRGMYCQRKPVPARFKLNLKVYFLRDLRSKIVRSVIAVAVQ